MGVALASQDGAADTLQTKNCPSLMWQTWTQGNPSTEWTETHSVTSSSMTGEDCRAATDTASTQQRQHRAGQEDHIRERRSGQLPAGHMLRGRSSRTVMGRHEGGPAPVPPHTTVVTHTDICEDRHMTHKPFWLQQEALGRACAVGQQGQRAHALLQKHQAHVCTQRWVTELRHTRAPALTPKHSRCLNSY